MWINSKEYAQMAGVSVRTVQRQIAAGKLESREVPGHGGNGMVFEVCVETSLKSRLTHPVAEAAPLTRGLTHPAAEAAPLSRGDFEKPAEKNKEIPEKVNDIPKLSDKNVNNTLHQRHFSDKNVVEFCKPAIKEASPQLSDISATTTVASEKQVNSMENNDLQKVNDMRQCTVASTVAPVVDIDNLLKNKEDKFFITTETTVALTNWHRSTLFRKIENNDIITIKQPKEGGGFLRLIDVRSLPVEAQEKWKQMTELRTEQDEVRSDMKPLNPNQRQYAYAMEMAIFVWLRYREEGKKLNIRKKDADRRFEDDIAAGKILTSEVNILDGISVKTLYRMSKRWETAGRRTAVLAPDRECNRGRKPIKAEGFYALANTWILTQPAVKAAHLYRQLAENIEKQNLKIQVPTYPTFLKFYNSVKNRQSLLIAKQQGTKTLDNIMPHVPRMNDALPGDIWQYDGYMMKVLVRNPWLQEGLTRPVVAYFFDVCTEMVTGFAVSFSERSDLIASAWYDAMTKLPAPKCLQPDNPVGIYNEQFLAKYIVENETRKKYIELKKRALEMTMTGRNGIFFDCGLQKIRFVTPGNSKGKKIEPAHFRIFREFETQPRFADVYVGKSPDDRPERLKRTNKAILADPNMKIPEWDWFLAELGKHIEDYNNRKRKMLQNYSPREAYEQMIDPKQKLSAEELEYKALWWEDRIPRNGYVKLFDEIEYQHPAFLVMKKVRIGYNVSDLSTLRVFDQTGREMSTPAVLVKKGSYVNDEISAEAIKANRSYKKKALILQTEILANDIKTLSNKELAQILNRTDISQEQKEIVQKRMNELEKYPEFGKIPEKSGLTMESPNKVETIQKEEDFDFKTIIDAEIEEEPEEDETWLKDIIESEEDKAEPKQANEPKNGIDKTLERLGIGGV